MRNLQLENSELQLKKDKLYLIKIKINLAFFKFCSAKYFFTNKATTYLIL